MEQKIIKILKGGGIGVMATDTIYGLVGSARQPETVERIYTLRGRDRRKPFIVLIANQLDLLNFGIISNQEMEKLTKEFWPGPTTIVLPCPLVNYKYLHRGKKTIAFRLPADAKLRTFLEATGPLVAPSANLAGTLPATSIEEAREYFGNKVDFYLDSGKVVGKPSKIIVLGKNGKIRILRK